jgi:D-alanyl-D-alanine carboxypeptidase (penicillin-binding protein 5/6)
MITKGFRIQTGSGLLGALVLSVALICSGWSRAAESYLAVDSFTGKILLELDSGRRMPAAGITKVATAMVVLDWARLSKTSMAEMAVVPTSVTTRGGANPMGLIPGDRISLREAMYSMLLGGDDAAAHTLAIHAGLSIQGRSGGASAEAAFLSEMNNLARVLGMTQTRFFTPEGTANGGSRNRSTARDLAALTIYAMRDAGFRFYVKQKQRTVKYMRGSVSRAFKVNNLHQLVGQGLVNGVVNGGMIGSGGCVATSSERKAEVTKLAGGASQIRPRRLIVIALGNPNPWGITKTLIDQGWPAYDAWRKQGSPVKENRELIRVPKPK